MQRSGDGSDLGGHSDQTASLGPMETASLLRDIAAVLEADMTGSPSVELGQWPDRLQASASVLCLASLRIKAALLDDDHFTRLTDPSLSSEQVLASVREFNAILETALQALIDLTGYDNPDQEYPDLTPWFEFRCPNVVFGRHTDTVRGEDIDMGHH